MGYRQNYPHPQWDSSIRKVQIAVTTILLSHSTTTQHHIILSEVVQLHRFSNYPHNLINILGQDLFAFIRSSYQLQHQQSFTYTQPSIGMSARCCTAPSFLSSRLYWRLHQQHLLSGAAHLPHVATLKHQQRTIASRYSGLIRTFFSHIPNHYDIRTSPSRPRLNLHLTSQKAFISRELFLRGAFN